MGTGCDRSNRAVDAANRAIASPLLEDNSIQGAQGILINICGSPSFRCTKFTKRRPSFKSRRGKRQHYFGAVQDETMKDAVENYRYRRGLQGSQQENTTPASAVHAAYLESGPRRRGRNSSNYGCAAGAKSAFHRDVVQQVQKTSAKSQGKCPATIWTFRRSCGGQASKA